MEPISAGILVGGQMLGNLFGILSQAEAQRRALKQQTETNMFQMGQQNIQAKNEAEQKSLGDLIAAYRSGLIRG